MQVKRGKKEQDLLEIKKLFMKITLGEKTRQKKFEKIKQILCENGLTIKNTLMSLLR